MRLFWSGLYFYSMLLQCEIRAGMIPKLNKLFLELLLRAVGLQWRRDFVIA
jgi:hypothetical protein